MHLAEGAIKELRRTQPPAQVQRVAQVGAEGWQVLAETGGGARLLALKLDHERAQSRFRVLGRSGFVAQ